MTTHSTPITSASTHSAAPMPFRRRIFAALVLSAAALGSAAQAGPSYDISHHPDPVNDRERVTINVSGVHNNGCVPRFERGQVNEGHRTIELVLESPSNANCTQALTPWDVSARTERPLSAGWWTVEVYWGSNYESYRFEVYRYAAHTSRIGFSHQEYDTSESAHTVYLNVERSGSSDGTVSVDYQTRDGSATAGRDYESTSGTLTWHHGDATPKRIPVVIYDDYEEEHDEYFRMELSHFGGDAEAGTHFEARVTIRDDDGHDQGSCRSDEYTLCLLGNRFQVTSRWRTKEGKSGRGQAKSLTGQSGYFWFFSESNVEVLVKMVDGCSASGTHWVFVSGMTNVWVEITVEDTWTGQRGTWTNPQGRDFQLIKDVNRFDSCR